MRRRVSGALERASERERTNAEWAHGGALSVDLRVCIRSAFRLLWEQRARRDGRRAGACERRTAEGQELTWLMLAMRLASMSGVISYPYLYRNEAASLCARWTCDRASAAPSLLLVSAPLVPPAAPPRLTVSAGHDAANVGSDVEDVRDRVRVEQLVLWA